MLICLLTVVKALKGRINSAQCRAKRSVGKKGIASRRRAVNSIVNCQWSIVMPGTRNPNATLCHSERSEESRPGKGKRFFAYALNDKCPNANFANGRTTLCHSERSEESRLERLRRSSLRPRAVSRRSSERGERKSGCPKRSELPDFPTRERREGV